MVRRGGDVPVQLGEADPGLAEGPGAGHLPVETLPQVLLQLLPVASLLAAVVGVVAVEDQDTAGDHLLGHEVVPRRPVVLAPGEGAELGWGGRQPGVAEGAHLQGLNT